MTTISKAAPQTALCSYTAESVKYGDQDLVSDLIGKVSFVDIFMKQTFGRYPLNTERKITEAVLVTLMEHGMTPSAIASRMIYASSPENIQAGVAAGLLAVGSRFVGTMEDAAVLLDKIAGEIKVTRQATAAQIVNEYRDRRQPVPGFGHHLHRPDDPRAIALIRLADDLGTSGAQVDALRLLAIEVDAAAGRHITINATGAIAAILGDIGIPASLMRGFAILSRAAGLISHIAEEQRNPAGRFIWDLVDREMGVSTS